ncbi:RHS repeat-associated core domain-containing protein [Snodgrassella alvi]|uniref:RHS repeat-associated core domain-containing protein n=1 Tax=Snodgrassella alvi TaxID=1196083 RepID=UPI000CC0DB6E|nr:RHS repeat-associated core domain-containing protein [Snodgrassella alvi]PIT14820.1 hypothetical protein BGI33_07330 [Snodgrassella alvi]PIT17414.1 hypothetical protein BGI34_07215 [Snodgrassella alvi]
MIQETGPNHPTSLYIYTDQNSYEPLARIDTDGNHEQHIRYFHTDLNGCPEELTDANGKILWECSFQLWGKRIHEIEHEPIEQNLRYQGQYLDRETGLHYNTFRYYDPDIGRFTQPDPIGLLGGFNLYQYAPNGLTWIDPLGWSCGSSKGFKRRNSVTTRWINRLTGKKASDVHDYLISKGWTVTNPQSKNQNAIQHIVYVKKTKSGVTYRLDYHPGGSASQPNIHGNDYWKVYKSTGKGSDEVLGRIGYGEFKNYDRIKDSPVYIDGKLMNGQ